MSKSLVTAAPKLTVAQRKIANKNEFQFYVLYGTNPGPWARVGINDTEYMVGYLPSMSTAQPRRKRRPSQDNVVPMKG